MLENETKKLLDAIRQFSETVYKETEIFIVNPFALMGIDMSNISSNCFFISYLDTEEGYIYKVKDGELKRSLYEFIEKYPDRVFRGEKDEA